MATSTALSHPTGSWPGRLATSRVMRRSRSDTAPAREGAEGCRVGVVRAERSAAPNLAQPPQLKQRLAFRGAGLLPEVVVVQQRAALHAGRR